MAKVRKMEKEDYSSGKSYNVRYWSYCCPGIGLPLLLILIGVWLIGRDLGWWKESINLWGVILLIIGVYWLLSRILTFRKR